MQTFNQTYYSAFAMYSPSWLPIPGNGAIFWQVHQSAALSPPLAFNMDSLGNYLFQRNVDDDEKCNLLRDYLPQGQYRRYFVEYKLDEDYSGFVKVWVDSVKKLDFEGQTAFIGDNTLETKCGVYKSCDASDFTLTFDDFRWGNDVWYGTQYSGIPSKPELIGHWKFDEELNRKNARDCAVECSYVGLLRNGVTQVTGYIGGGLYFDGNNDYVSIPDSPIWDTGSAITVSCRFKTGTNQSNKGLVLHDNSNYKYMLHLTVNSGDIRFYVRTACGETSVCVNNGDGYFADSQWHYVVGVYDRYAADGNRLKLYVDGVAATPAGSLNEDIFDGDEGIYIGRRSTGYFH